MMKLDSILIILIVNAIFWSLINSVKNNENKNELTRVGKTSKDNDMAESSVDPQIRMLKPKPKITKKGTKKDKKEEKKFNRKEYMKIYWKNNRESKREYDRKYRENNLEKKRKTDRKYRENNREKRRESARKYREKKKNRKTNLQDPTVLGIVHSDNNERGTSNPQNDDFRNKDKLPIVYEEGIQSEEGNLINREEEETETNLDEQNQQMVKEPNRIPENCMNQIDLNEKYYPFDLNEKPEDGDEDVC